MIGSGFSVTPFNFDKKNSKNEKINDAHSFNIGPHIGLLSFFLSLFLIVQKRE